MINVGMVVVLYAHGNHGFDRATPHLPRQPLGIKDDSSSTETQLFKANQSSHMHVRDKAHAGDGSDQRVQHDYRCAQVAANGYESVWRRGVHVWTYVRRG